MPGEKVTILVVDDSINMLQQLEVFLSGEGFEVSRATNANEGLEKARGAAYDLCIVDVNMPGMNGLEMIRELRTYEGYAETPVFVLTTESTKDLLALGKEVGATAWIVKPFKQEIMLKGIRKVLQKAAS